MAQSLYQGLILITFGMAHPIIIHKLQSTFQAPISISWWVRDATNRQKEGRQPNRQTACPPHPPATHSLFLNVDIISKNHMHLIHKYTSVFDFCNMVLCCWVSSSWCFKTTQCLHCKGHRAQKYWIVIILLWKPQILHMCLNQHFVFVF